jgi:hypothetical protein
MHPISPRKIWRSTCGQVEKQPVSVDLLDFHLKCVKEYEGGEQTDSARLMKCGEELESIFEEGKNALSEILTFEMMWAETIVILFFT